MSRFLTKIGLMCSRRRFSGASAASRRALCPELEPIEGRLLLSASGLHSAIAPTHEQAALPVASTTGKTSALDRYRVFIGRITQGPDAGVTVEGPIVVGYSGRIQVTGQFFPKRGPVAFVAGTQTGGSVALRIVMAGGGAFEAVGSGSLQSVRGGLPGGYSLVGSGNFSGPQGNDTGTWVTLRPTRVAGH